MGKERASSIRQQRSEAQNAAMQRVFVRFELHESAVHAKGVWRASYQDHSLKRELGRPSRFAHADVVRKLVERSAESPDLDRRTCWR